MPAAGPARKPNKYQPLGDWLAAHTSPLLALSFSAVEQVLRSPLPHSARADPGWWTDYHPQAPHYQAWHAVGWEAVAVNRRRQLVIFRRIEAA
jgi:hypothetical protein